MYTKRLSGNIACLMTLMGVLLLVGLSSVTAQTDSVVLPEPTGMYSVGRSIYEWMDTDRAEIYSEDPTAKRELIVSIWYPADLSTDSDPAPYLPAPLTEVIKQAFNVDTSLVQSHAYVDVPVSAQTETYPVLVFQPGNVTFLFTYATLLEEIASHGYIVVGISPTYNVPVTIFSDGRMIQGIPEAAQADQTQIDVWTGDALFVLQQLELLNNEDAQFAGKLDLERLGFFGHSFGGATAANVCHQDQRCIAGIDIDGAILMDEPTVSQPFMILFSDHPACEVLVIDAPDMTLEQCEAFIAEQTLNWESIYTSAQLGYRLVVSGSVHNSFTDNAFLLPIMPQLAQSINEVSIDAERALQITSDYVVAFFDYYLSDADTELLSGASPDYPEVQFERSGE